MKDWFIRTTRTRYVTHRDILDQIKIIYPWRKEELNITWVQNFCRSRPQMSGKLSDC